jgi:DUF3040 family protein
MSLNVRERHTLRAIEARLTRADPELAAKLDLFSRLTAGEQMPPRERVRTRGRRATRRSLGPHHPGNGHPGNGHPGNGQPSGRQDGLRDLARRPIRRMGWQRAVLLLWLITALAMTATALALSHAGGGWTCAPPWTVCTSQPHAAAPHPAAPRSTARQVSRVSSPAMP